MAYGERNGHVRPVVDLADRRALVRSRARRPPPFIEQARRLKEAALLDFGIKD